MITAPTRRVLVAVASVMALAALTGCGAVSDFMPGRDPFLDQSPQSMAKAAFADMREVTSLRVLGSIESRKSGFTRIDLLLDETDCSGSLDSPAGTIKVLKNSEGAWFSADDKFWRTQTKSPGQAGQMVSAYAGRWGVMDGRDPMLDLCDLDDLLSAFTLDGDDAIASIEAGEVVQIGGLDAVPVTGQDGKKRVTAWVSLHGPHRVLKVAPARDTGRPDALYFEEFGVEVDAASPPKKDTVVIPPTLPLRVSDLRAG